MATNNQNEEIPAEDEMVEKIKKRERKKRKRMPVSGKEVFKLRELRIKKQEPREKDGDNLICD